MHLPRNSAKNPFSLAPVLAIVVVAMIPSLAVGQVRGKKPDRGVYRSPVLPAAASKAEDPSASQLADLVRSQAPSDERDLAASERDDDSQQSQDDLVQLVRRDASPLREVVEIVETSPRLQRVGHEDVILVQPSREHVVHMDEVWTDEGNSTWTEEIGVMHDSTCDGCSNCDSMGCDSSGCDSMGDCGPSRWQCPSLCLPSDSWFGSAELMLMFRSGDRLPVLVTTGPSTDPDTAGEIGQPGTQTLFGGDTVLKDMTAGGRFTVGTWLDNQHCRSLVMRGWFAGEETIGFHSNQNLSPVIARPFLNVSDNQAAAQDTQLITFPDRASGSISINASSNVFGGDLQVRQFSYGRFGGTVEMLYGYQYMRLNEDLSISGTSTSLDDDFAPVGSVISVADVFDTENEFHGGQLGMATRYREGCWSFNGLAKVGFGSLRRRAKLRGTTFTSIDGLNATDPNGLLVRSTNSGNISDDTFGWVPELDLTLGWQRYANFDVTVGYHITAMTDALQVSGAIDPNRAVNFSVPPTGQQRPAAALRYSTFYVQGIHFGLQYIY